MESAGARLRKLRLEKGFDLEEVQKKTKIHLSILKSIEEDNFINISPVYLKGFLKLYCQFLGVNPKDYLVGDKAVPAQTQINTVNVPLKLTSPKTRTRKKIILSLILVLLFAGLGVFTFKKIFRTKAFKPASAKMEIKKEKTARLAKPQQKSSGQTISLKELPPVPAYQSEKTGLKDSAYQIRLVIRSKEDCWVQLKLDGRLAFQNILKKGLFESWQARQKIEFSLGNAGGIDLEVNGKLIPSLGRRGQVLKNILVTREGLYIPQ